MLILSLFFMKCKILVDDFFLHSLLSCLFNCIFLLSPDCGEMYWLGRLKSAFATGIKTGEIPYYSCLMLLSTGSRVGLNVLSWHLERETEFIDLSTLLTSALQRNYELFFLSAQLSLIRSVSIFWEFLTHLLAHVLLHNSVSFICKGN